MEDVSLGIPRQSVVAILGPNGSGKTTLLHLILGLLKPARGEILFFGRPRSDITSFELRRQLGLVPQEERIPFDLSLLEYVLLGRAPHLNLLQLPGDTDRRIALHAIQTVGLSGLEARSVPSLSGGERQLASIARALAQGTDILFLDEPTSHLDLVNTKRILDVMVSLGRAGKTVVFTTHDPNAASIVADRVVLLREGRIMAAGRLKDVFSPENLTRTYGIDIKVMFIEERPFLIPF
jgi:iron complex transport system ATP-binding protein